MVAYRIEYSIQRAVDEDEQEFEEIGFGSSGAWGSVDQAEFALGSYVQNRQWETEPGMPDPADIKEES